LKITFYWDSFKELVWAPIKKILITRRSELVGKLEDG